MMHHLWITRLNLDCLHPFRLGQASIDRHVPIGHDSGRLHRNRLRKLPDRIGSANLPFVRKLHGSGGVGLVTTRTTTTQPGQELLTVARGQRPVVGPDQRMISSCVVAGIGSKPRRHCLIGNHGFNHASMSDHIVVGSERERSDTPSPMTFQAIPLDDS